MCVDWLLPACLDVSLASFWHLSDAQQEGAQRGGRRAAGASAHVGCCCQGPALGRARAWLARAVRGADARARSASPRPPRMQLGVLPRGGRWARCARRAVCGASVYVGGYL